MKAYHGTQTDYGRAVVVDEDGHCRGLDPRRDLRNHSAEFNWGYGGSGPAQLALALAADVLGDDDRALAVYQRLKFRLIGRLPDEGWSLSEDRIRAAIEAIEQERQHAR
jgi:hypothetical protein